MGEKYTEFIRKARADYYKIGSISCPAFNNEPVFFNKYGFNHLIRKGRKPRPADEGVRRIRLLPYAIATLLQYKNFDDHRRSTRTTGKNGFISTADFWSFKSRVQDRMIIVIVRTTNNGSKHFFSVMTSGQRINTKDP